MPTRYFTRWPTEGRDHAEMQVRNGSVLIQRPGCKDFAEFMNGDYMGRLPGLPPGVVEVSARDFKRMAPECINPK